LEAASRAKETPADVRLTRDERASELKAQQARLDKATSDLETQENDDLKEKIEWKQTEIKIAKNVQSSLPIGVRPMHNPLPGLQKELEQLESETAEHRMDLASARIRELNAEVTRDEKNAADEKSAFDEAKEAATNNAKRIVDLKQQITEAQDAARIKSETAAQQILSLAPFLDTKNFEKVAGVNTPGGAASLVQQFQEAQRRLASRHGTAGDSDLVRLMNELLSRTQEADAAMFQTLEKLINQQRDTASRFNRPTQ
jgi:hypothetical protein